MMKHKMLLRPSLLVLCDTYIGFLNVEKTGEAFWGLAGDFFYLTVMVDL